MKKIGSSSPRPQAWVVLLALVSSPFACVASASSGPTITMQACSAGTCDDAGMSPAFDPAVSDYVVHCAGADTMTLSAGDLGTTRVVFRGETSSGASFTSAPFSLAPNRAVSWRLRGTGNKYYARCLPADFPTWTTTIAGTPQARWFLFSPTTSHYAIVADPHGTPVWWMDDPDGSPIDVTLTSHGVLTWSELKGGYSTDSHWTLHSLDGRVLGTIGGDTDVHDVKRMPNGHYLVTRYIVRNCPDVPSDCVDLSPWGGNNPANVVDGEVVEFDAGNNEVFSWSTRDHLALAESAPWITQTLGPTDIVHLNAVAPDGNHAFVFSGRNVNAVYHVDMRTGAIDWKLGGTPTAESLTVVGYSGGDELFSGQHDAYLLRDGTLTVHDNGSGAGRGPRALRFRIDATHRTATLLEMISDPRVGDSSCCGSARRLSRGDWVMSWGRSSLITELTPEGEPVLTMQLSSGFSYRALPIDDHSLTAARLRAGMDRIAGGS